MCEKDCVMSSKFFCYLPLISRQYTLSSRPFILGWLMVCEETEISALGFFYVSKSSMLAAFSTILGYLIVLVQFAQSDTPN